MTRKKKSEVSPENASTEADSNEESEISGEGSIEKLEATAEPAREKLEATAEPAREPTLEDVKSDLEKLFASANAEGRSARGNAIARAMFIVDEAINTR